ncbi:sensor histidine kinase [Candidatus Nitrosocosmicus arcticus]|nr:sensor histidine kinase [Candidatus Nitrosocosmicus arcticus]
MVLSYNYFTQTANQIQELAIDELETNSEIEAHSISNSLSNAIYAITSNLEIIANSPSTVDENISTIQTLLNIGRDSTNNLTDGYYFLDKNGRLTTFTGIEKEENVKYKGVDLSYRNYFQIPKHNGTLYISTVIDSNDNVPRIYISMPVFENNKKGLEAVGGGQLGGEVVAAVPSSLNRNLTSFKGVVVASIEAETLGNFLEGQIHPKFNGDIGFIDRNGTVIYTQNQTFIGKNYFGNEFQSYLKLILKDKAEEFNNILNKAFLSESGVEEFNFENISTTIAYEAVKGSETDNSINEYGNMIGTLFITVPHTLAGNVTSLIDNQNSINFSIIGIIVAISTVTAIILLRWNKLLNDNVKQKTFQLRDSIEKLEKANEDLKSHDKMQKEFINIAAHELRTPTQAISGNLELIQMSYVPSIFQTSSSGQIGIKAELERLVKDEDKLLDYSYALVSTYRNAQRLEKLVNDILDTSRIESNRLELHKESFNLNEKIQNVIKDIHNKTSLSSHNGDSSTHIDIVFEPQEDPIMVSADKIRIFEVLSNLINNAIKFSNGKPIIISAKTFQKNEIGSIKSNHNNELVDIENTIKNKDEKMMIVVVSVKDRGKGIDSDILPRLFTKFVTKSDQGTGLGLYIAKNIIEAHGGQIWAQNNYNGDKGATFSFSLQIDQEFKNL